MEISEQKFTLVKRTSKIEQWFIVRITDDSNARKTIKDCNIDASYIDGNDTVLESKDDVYDIEPMPDNWENDKKLFRHARHILDYYELEDEDYQPPSKKKRGRPKKALTNKAKNGTMSAQNLATLAMGKQNEIVDNGEGVAETD